VGNYVSVEDVALFGHLVGVLLLVSGAAVAAVAFESGRRRETPAEIAAVLGIARTGALLAMLGIVLVPVFGFWLVSAADWGTDEGWLQAAFLLFVVAAVLGGIGGRAPRHARELAEQLAREGKPASPELRALLDDPAARLLNYGSGVVLLAVLVLMVWKPGASHS
jgi:uncharacterized membrane protein